MRSQVRLRRLITAPPYHLKVMVEYGRQVFLTFKQWYSVGMGGVRREAKCPIHSRPHLAQRAVSSSTAVGRRPRNEVEQYARLETERAALIRQRLEWSFDEPRGRQLATHICRTSANELLALPTTSPTTVIDFDRRRRYCCCAVHLCLQTLCLDR